MNLLELAKVYGTQKIQHNFPQIYEKYFLSIRESVRNLLEIGVWEGCSLRMWREYLHQANIWGLDIDPRAKISETDRIKVFIGSQDDCLLVEEIVQQVSSFDVIIDDGSHVNTLTIKTFELFFPLLADGGLYFIEDLHCSYGPALLEWPGMVHNHGVNFDNKRSDMNEFFCSLLEKLDNNELNFVHFYPKLCVIGKKG